MDTPQIEKHRLAAARTERTHRTKAEAPSAAPPRVPRSHALRPDEWLDIVAKGRRR